MKTCRNLVENYIIRRKEQLITVAKYEPCHEQTTVRLCETKGADRRRSASSPARIWHIFDGPGSRV